LARGDVLRITGAGDNEEQRAVVTDLIQSDLALNFFPDLALRLTHA
jgi:hypothetical protein